LLSKASLFWTILWKLLGQKLIKIGAKVVSHGRHVTFQMARSRCRAADAADILPLLAQLRAPPAPA
jgi:hypothetical protein